MADPKPALHKALCEHLSAAVTAETLSAPVYDGVPQGSALPYVTLDTSVSDDDRLLNGRREQVFTYLHVWSDSPGQHEVLEIMAELDALLDRKTLALDTGRIATMRVRRTSTHRDADNVTFQGRMTLWVILDH